VRLAKVEGGHGLLTRIKLGMIRLMMGDRAPDVIRTMLYRPEFFGAAYSNLMHEVMRGPSDWSVGERELFAAFVSQQNRCRF
jgi:hypothetical protein